MSVRAADERIARTPYREREERDRGQHREKRADDTAMNAEVRARRDRVARAVARPEQAHRRENAGAREHAEHDRPHARLERKPDQNRKAAEHRSRKRVAAAEQQAEQIDRPRVSRSVGNALETECLDLRNARVVSHVVSLLMRRRPANRLHRVRRLAQSLLAVIFLHWNGRHIALSKRSQRVPANVWRRSHLYCMFRLIRGTRTRSRACHRRREGLHRRPGRSACRLMPRFIARCSGTSKPKAVRPSTRIRPRCSNGSA